MKFGLIMRSVEIWITAVTEKMQKGRVYGNNASQGGSVELHVVSLCIHLIEPSSNFVERSSGRLKNLKRNASYQIRRSRLVFGEEMGALSRFRTITYPWLGHGDLSCLLILASRSRND